MTVQARDSQVDVAVLVVTYQSGAVLGGFLQALPAALDGAGSWVLVVIDNASIDDTLGVVGALAPDAVLVRSPGNVGYAAALNAGLRAAPTAAAYLFTNPDLRLAAGSVRLLQQALSGTIGVAVPRLLDAEGALRPSLRHEPTLLRVLGEALLGGRRAERLSSSLSERVADPAAYAKATVADWATGAALLCSRACVEAIGAWDESYFLYSEETDYLLRARDRGFRLQLVPAANAVHLGGDAHTNSALYALLTLNRYRFYRTRHGAGPSLAFWLVLLLSEALRSRSALHRAALRAVLLRHTALGAKLTAGSEHATHDGG